MANEKTMDVVILGLLRHEPMTGYEIKKRIDASLRFFWGASYGSIYPTLNALQAEGKLTSVESSEGGRRKITYSLTQAGHAQLAAWLDRPAERDEIRFETLLKLFFAGEGEGKMAIGHLRNFQSFIQGELPWLHEAVEHLRRIQEGSADHLYYMLTAQCGVSVYEALLKWCEDSIAILTTSEEKDG